MKKLFISFIIIIFGLSVYAEPDSLKALETAKFVVDLNQGDGNRLKTRLSLILETIDNIAENGVKPVAAVAVRGPASRFMTVNDSYISPEDAKVKSEISALTDELRKRGVKLEQCAIALRFLYIKPEEIQPKFEVVKNGYVSLIGYQNRGYAILPME